MKSEILPNINVGKYCRRFRHFLREFMIHDDEAIKRCKFFNECHALKKMVSIHKHRLGNNKSKCRHRKIQIDMTFSANHSDCELSCFSQDKRGGFLNKFTFYFNESTLKNVLISRVMQFSRIFLCR